MESFAMKIAGVVIGVQPLFESTREYCKAYLTDTAPDFTVQINREDLPAEQKKLEEEAIEQGLKIRKFKELFLERSMIQRRVADYLLDRDTVMLHGSTVAVDGRAYLFTAPCGTGKSTHTRLWRELFGERAVMVNDDKPFLRITNDGVIAYGSPWTGKHGLGSNVCVPLQGICALQRGRENVIRQADGKELMDILHHQVHTPEDPTLARKAMDHVDRIARMVPLWIMSCNKELHAAEVSHEAMYGNLGVK